MIISICALAVSGVSAWFSWNANDIARDANDLSSARNDLERQASLPLKLADARIVVWSTVAAPPHAADGMYVDGDDTEVADDHWMSSTKRLVRLRFTNTNSFDVFVSDPYITLADGRFMFPQYRCEDQEFDSGGKCTMRLKAGDNKGIEFDIQSAKLDTHFTDAWRKRGLELCISTTLGQQCNLTTLILPPGSAGS
ncbi:hypothetical protein ACFVMC_28265 [Nocardia sp. NPDC127579]|uniref:hypothetical protein n=1 Tax=Nocardia sp. NPDC127579 TaxID=3345402 RepID=UPI003624EF13